MDRSSALQRILFLSDSSTITILDFKHNDYGQLLITTNNTSDIWTGLYMDRSSALQIILICMEIVPIRWLYNYDFRF